MSFWAPALTISAPPRPCVATYVSAFTPLPEGGTLGPGDAWHNKTSGSRLRSGTIRKLLRGLSTALQENPDTAPRARPCLAWRISDLDKYADAAKTFAPLGKRACRTQPSAMPGPLRSPTPEISRRRPTCSLSMTRQTCPQTLASGRSALDRYQ